MGKSYEFYIKTMKSIGFTSRIPRYITDRQNYIGFTYKSPITCLYLFTLSESMKYKLDKSFNYVRCSISSGDLLICRILKFDYLREM